MPTNSLLRIGQNIAILRKRKGLTQAQLAQKLGTSQSSVARMEAGRQNLTTETINELNRILGANITLPANTIFPSIDTPNIRLNLEIEGKRPLKGTVTVHNSKNSAVALQYAALINRGRTILKGIPQIEEVHRNNEVLQSIGVSVRWGGENELHILPPPKLQLSNLNQAAAIKTRSILLALGALLHHFDRFTLPYPGGCKLGKRPLQSHLYALEELGISVNLEENHLAVSKEDLHPGRITMYEISDTGTENALLAAAAIPKTSKIWFASSNYMVRDLCYFLTQLGVKIKGIGTSTLEVQGFKERPRKEIVYHLSEDPIEAMFFIAAAATTNSEITIKRLPIDFVRLELFKLKKMGWKFKVNKEYKSYNQHTKLVDIHTFKSKLTAPLDKLHPLPYPGINIDNLPFFVPIATQARGRTLIHDWVYENRAIYYTELNKLGAQILLADPHRVYVEGPTQLKANEVICPEALRPGAIILIAMLASEGTSILRNVYSINRGYEDLFHRLNNLGAKIKTFS